MTRLWLLAITAAVSSGWGSPVCRPCHAARVQAQAATPHARAMAPYTGAHFAGRSLADRAGTRFNYTADGIRIEKGGEAITTPVAWTFGSGEQAITLLLSRGSRWIEHRVTWYKDGDRLGLTPGHDPSPGIDLAESLGVVQTDRNAGRCFGCHRTEAEPGVHCQACHGDGTAHRRAPARGNIQRNRAVAVCAACHRSPDETYFSAMPELEDPRSIRFAPIGLQVSQCFVRSKRLTCITCHDPHGEPRQATVNEVCKGCHTAGARARCPRTPTGCTGCHMKASSPAPGLRFTDHRIRLYSD